MIKENNVKCNCQRDKQKKEEYKMTRRRTEEENKTMKIVFMSVPYL